MFNSRMGNEGDVVFCSQAASARAADALAKVASHNAWETERSNLLAELDADR